MIQMGHWLHGAITQICAALGKALHVGPGTCGFCEFSQPIWVVLDRKQNEIKF